MAPLAHVGGHSRGDPRSKTSIFIQGPCNITIYQFTPSFACQRPFYVFTDWTIVDKEYDLRFTRQKNVISTFFQCNAKNVTVNTY